MKKQKSSLLTFNILIVFLFTSLFLILSQKGYGALPVFDSSSVAKAVQQIKELKKQYEMLQKQFDELKSMKENMMGSYGMGLIGNSPLDKKNRRTLPKTWKEVVSLQVSGDIPGFYSDRINHFENLFPEINQELFVNKTKNRMAKAYDLSHKNTQAAFAATETIYNQIQDRLKIIEELTDEIDQTENIKEATDLNSRLVAEGAFLNIEMARLGSLQLSLQSHLQNHKNQAIANHAEFFGSPIN